MVYGMMGNMFSYPMFFVWFIPLVIWELIWKGFGLWKSAQRNHTVWFVLILIFNTVGILPILYLIFSNDSETPKKSKTFIKKKR